MSAPSRSLPLEDRYRLAGATLEGRIRVERPVARGGFGVVYRAFHLGLHAPVALKVLHVPEQYSDAVKDEFRRRFVQEAQLVYQLAHPAVVRLLDHGVSWMPSGEPAPWMVLEWLDGATLGHALHDRRAAGTPFAPREALALLRPVLEALAMVHARGVAHRDVTPANVFLCPSPAGPYARLIDFGVARVMEVGEGAGSGVTATQSSITAFSKAYAAPEQLGQTRTGPWTDVHALALIFTEMLTLRPPYEGADLAEVLGAALSPTRPTPAAKGVDAGPFEAVLRRAMALRPADRHPDAGALLAALDEADRAPALAPKRSRRVAKAAALWLGGALVVGGAAGVTLARRSRPTVTTERRPAVAAPAPAPAPPAPPAAPPPAPALPAAQPPAPAAPPEAPRASRTQGPSRHRRAAPREPDAPAPRVNGETIRENPFAR